VHVYLQLMLSHKIMYRSDKFVQLHLLCSAISLSSCSAMTWHGCQQISCNKKVKAAHKHMCKF